MTKRAQDQIAWAFGVDPEIVPLLPDLLADFEALGGWPEHVVTVLRESAELPEGAEVVDLGCGKGAISIAIARELGCRVKGLDLFEPFVEHAASTARAAGVDRLCSFEVADARDLVKQGGAFDAAVFAAVGAGLFGDHSDCMAALRSCVRPRGYVVLCDGFLRRAMHPDSRFPGYESYETHDETLRQLTAHGDVLVREILVSKEDFARQNLRDLEKLRSRVRALSETRPQHRARFREFLRAQEAEYDFLDNETTDAIWLLRRAG